MDNNISRSSLVDMKSFNISKVVEKSGDTGIETENIREQPDDIGFKKNDDINYNDEDADNSFKNRFLSLHERRDSSLKIAEGTKRTVSLPVGEILRGGTDGGGKGRDIRDGGGMSLREIMEEMTPKIRRLHQLDEFRSGASEDLKYLRVVSGYGRTEAIQNEMGMRMSQLNVPELFQKIWRRHFSDEFLSGSNSVVYENMMDVLAVLVNMTEKCVRLCKHEFSVRLYEDILTFLKSHTLQIINKKHHQNDKLTPMVWGLLKVVYNMAQNISKARQPLRDQGAVTILMPYHLNHDQSIACQTLLLLAYVINEEENEVVHFNLKSFKLLVSVLDVTLESRDSENVNKEFTSLQIASALNRYAADDLNKPRIIQSGALPLYVRMLGAGSSVHEQSAAAEGLWLLAFKCGSDILQEPGCVEAQQNLLKNTDNKKLKTQLTGLLWIMQNRNRFIPEKPNPRELERVKSERRVKKRHQNSQSINRQKISANESVKFNGHPKERIFESVERLDNGVHSNGIKSSKTKQVGLTSEGQAARLPKIHNGKEENSRTLLESKSVKTFKKTEHTDNISAERTSSLISKDLKFRSAGVSRENSAHRPGHITKHQHPAETLYGNRLNEQLKKTPTSYERWNSLEKNNKNDDLIKLQVNGLDKRIGLEARNSAGGSRKASPRNTANVDNHGKINDEKAHDRLINANNKITAVRELSSNGKVVNKTPNSDSSIEELKSISTVDSQPQPLAEPQKVQFTERLPETSDTSEIQNGNSSESDIISEELIKEDVKHIETSSIEGEDRLTNTDTATEKDTDSEVEGATMQSADLRPISSQQRKHLFISYQWNHKKSVLKLRDLLRSSGYLVWVDVDNMAGSVLEAMAEAVENAAVMIVCLTQSYKESPNCRTEAEYAFRLKKEIVPVRLESGYNPDGWLGALTGSKLVHDLSDGFDNNAINDLYRDLGERGKATARTPTPLDSEIEERVSVLEVNPTSEVALTQWTVESVTDWLNQNQLGHKKSWFSGFSGPMLIEFAFMRRDAPEFFFALLQENEFSLVDILRLSRALTDMLSLV